MPSPRVEDLPAPRGLSIGEASELLGVPTPTLRSWELRYGVPQTLRSTGGHRRYSPGDITQLRYMRDQIAAGRPAADAARRTRTQLDEGGDAWVFIAAILDGTRDGDADAIRGTLDDAYAAVGMSALLDGTVMPAMRQVGALWESGCCDLGQAQFTSEVVRGWLATRVAGAPEPVGTRGVLLAVGPRDLHTLGVEALAALLRESRVGVRVLGPRTSINALVAATTATDPDAVVVVSHLTTQRRSAVDSLKAVAQTGTATFYAGNAFLIASYRKDVPGTYLGESLTGAADLLSTHLARPVV